jgi:hypothetical protein
MNYTQALGIAVGTDDPVVVVGNRSAPTPDADVIAGHQIVSFNVNSA